MKNQTESIVEIAAKNIFGQSIDHLNLIQKARVYKQSLHELFAIRQNIGQTILSILWEVYYQGLIQYMGENGEEYNPEDFNLWLLNEFEEYEPTYVRQLGLVFTRVLQDVWAAEMAKAPYVDRHNDKITVNRLLQGRSTSKLIVASNSWDSVPKTEKSAILDSVIYETVEKVKARVQMAINDGNAILLPYKIKQIEDQLVFEIYISSEPQRKILESVLKRIGKQEL